MEEREQVSQFLMYDFEYAFKFKKLHENFDKLWNMKMSTRTGLKDWLMVSNTPPKIAELFANACSELIENCIKYTQEGSTATILIHVVDPVITVETINTTDRQHRQLLQATLHAMMTAENVTQIFVEKLLHPVAGASHLGLMKIVMETKGTLELVPESADDLVHMRLHLRVDRHPPTSAAGSV